MGMSFKKNKENDKTKNILANIDIFFNQNTLILYFFRKTYRTDKLALLE